MGSEKKKDKVEDKYSTIDIVKWIFMIITINFVLSAYVTGTATWGIETRWTNPRYVQFRAEQLMGKPLLQLNEKELSQYNGANPDLPLYLAVGGKVFDVSSNRITYGPGGPYSHFAGRDASRAFFTGCFSTDLTHDLRGLDQEAALAAVAGWQSFFDNSHKYWHVGFVSHPPLTGDPPKPCENGVGQIPAGKPHAAATAHHVNDNEAPADHVHRLRGPPNVAEVPRKPHAVSIARVPRDL